MSFIIKLRQRNIYDIQFLPEANDFVRYMYTLGGNSHACQKLYHKRHISSRLFLYVSVIFIICFRFYL